MKAQIIRIITGLTIIAVGIGFLLDNAGIIDFSSLAATWWPLAVIFAGVLIFLNDTRSYLWALLVAGIGIMFQLRELGIVTVNPWQLFWPAVIIVVGLSVILSRAPRNRVNKANRDDVVAVLGGSDQKNASENYQGSKFTVIMGGAKLDLRKAKIKNDATIEIFSLMGGVELIVPRDVVIRNQTSAILGGVENKTDQDDIKNAPVLYITGDVIMAGVEIKN